MTGGTGSGPSSASPKDTTRQPGTLGPEMREFALGIYRLDDRPIVVTDVDRVLDITVQ